MKPIYLEFCGINSFSETAKIDFGKLLEGGIFGIFGDTGSGKSTILDAIHFALYGEVDRVPKSFSDCINHKCDRASVIFDFALQTQSKRKTYRVERERKRKNSATKAYLYEYTDDNKLFPIAEGTRDVDSAVIQLVGLTFEDFKTCIALPQGDFATLVKSTPSERVKLVARLFNLERYGERLSIAINQKSKEADEAVRLVQAKMGENTASEEERTALKEKKEQLQKALKESEKEREIALVNRNNVEQAEKEKHAFESLKKRYNELCEHLEQMQDKQKKAERYPGAKAVCDKADALARTQANREKALINAKNAETDYTKWLESAKAQKQAFEEKDYEAKILEQTLKLEKIAGAQADIQSAEQAKSKFEACCEEYRKIKDKYPKEDFETQRKQLEEKLCLLGEDEGLLAFLKKDYKGVLLADTYGEVRADLQTLGAKHPQTQEDVTKLIAKYSVENVNAGEMDIAKINLEYKKAEQERKALKTRLQELEERERAYKNNESEKELLIKHGKMLREALDVSTAKIADIKALGDEKEMQKTLQSLKDEQNRAKAKIEETDSKSSHALAEWQTQKTLAGALLENAQAQESELKTSLKENAFASVDEARTTLLDAPASQEEVKAFFEEYTATRLRLAETDESKWQDLKENALEIAEESLRMAQAKVAEYSKELGGVETRLKALEQTLEKYKTLEKEKKEKEKYARLCEQLKTLVRGNRFLEYIASEYLQEICTRAGKTLLSLTGGRYFLRYEEKEFKVGDNLDGGKLRATKTLSGGETFLVSLSLALSLSTAIFMKSLRPIEFFFLDEGFGTLDEKLVDTVMDVLGKLSKNFSVGLISHVEELKRRIENKIVVTPAGVTHGSKIQ